MSQKCEKKRSLRVRLWWRWGLAAKATADLLAVLTLYHQFNYIIAAPVVLIAWIVLTVWASSSWMYAIIVSGLFLVNVFLCGCIAQVYGFWSNPWIVVCVWLWGFAAVICLLTTFVRCCCSVLYSILKRKGKTGEPLFSDVYRSQTSDKRIAPVLAILILAVLVVLVGILIRFEARRENIYIECDPIKMIVHLEKIFKIDFPEEIKGAKASKTRGCSWDRWSEFMLKLDAEPNDVNTFLGSFPEKIHFKPYERKKDFRGGPGIIPAWFKEPIQQGKYSLESLRGPRKVIHNIYVDTTDEKNFVVYIEGSYSWKLGR
ncbi:MAG: hypothetical protein ACYSUY_10610 [Planctomycetota bacterium]|jgi:hypothetical protein